MTDGANRAAVARALELAAIAVEVAKLAGVDITVTPCPQVIIKVGDPPSEVPCIGVQFDREYLLVLLPQGRWRALKVDPSTGAVVLRLACYGGWRPHVVRVLTALIYDRVKAAQSKLEPRIELLAPQPAPVLLHSPPEPPVFPTPRQSNPKAPQAPAPAPHGPGVAAPAAPAAPKAVAPVPPPAPAAPAAAPQAPQATGSPLRGRVRR